MQIEHILAEELAHDDNKRGASKNMEGDTIILLNNYKQDGCYNDRFKYSFLLFGKREMSPQ